MRVNSVNGGRKDKGGSKRKKQKKRERDKINWGEGGAKIWPPHLNSASCRVTQSTPKKNILFLFLLFF